MGFSLHKAELPLESRGLQEIEEESDEKHIGELTRKKCLLTIDLKPCRSKVKGKYSADKKIGILAAQGKKLLTQTSRSGDRKTM